MNILRDKRLTTKILILAELSSNPHHKFKTLGDKFDMTVQAVSDYFKIMKKEGLVRKVGGAYKPTQRGILFLHSHFTDLREFVDGQMHKLNIIDLCTAVAGGRIRPGDRVGLFMEGGDLRAYKNRSSTSMGIAISEAEKDEDVGVKELEGIVHIDPGHLHILQIPSVSEGGSKRIDLRALKRIIRTFSPDRMAVIGTVAKVTLNKLNMEPEIEFTVPRASLEACQRGLNVMVLSDESGVHDLVNEVNEYNLSSEEKVRFELGSFPKKGSRRKSSSGRKKE